MRNRFLALLTSAAVMVDTLCIRREGSLSTAFILLEEIFNVAPLEEHVTPGFSPRDVAGAPAFLKPSFRHPVELGQFVSLKSFLISRWLLAVRHGGRYLFTHDSSNLIEERREGILILLGHGPL
jgi:hypothetical protein